MAKANKIATSLNLALMLSLLIFVSIAESRILGGKSSITAQTLMERIELFSIIMVTLTVYTTFCINRLNLIVQRKQKSIELVL